MGHGLSVARVPRAVRGENRGGPPTTRTPGAHLQKQPRAASVMSSWPMIGSVEPMADGRQHQRAIVR